MTVPVSSTTPISVRFCLCSSALVCLDLIVDLMVGAFVFVWCMSMVQIEIVALKVLKKGDDQYRAGTADDETVQSLPSACILFKVCKQFCTVHELPFDMNET